MIRLKRLKNIHKVCKYVYLLFLSFSHGKSEVIRVVSSQQFSSLASTVLFFVIFSFHLAIHFPYYYVALVRELGKLYSTRKVLVASILDINL